MKLRRKFFAAVSSLAVAVTVLLAGCGAPAQEGTALKETGTLTLSVNPEIQIEYNGDGKVTALTGRNDDGKDIVEAYPDYIGKDCETVLRDLIVEINEAGYFVDDIDGNKKNIVLQLEPGSVLPSDDFLADMSTSTQEAVKGLNLSSGIVTIDEMCIRDRTSVGRGAFVCLKTRIPFEEGVIEQEISSNPSCSIRLAASSIFEAISFALGEYFTTIVLYILVPPFLSLRVVSANHFTATLFLKNPVGYVPAPPERCGESGVSWKRCFSDVCHRHPLSSG